MTVIHGHFYDVLGKNSVATLTIRSAKTRAGTDLQGLVTTEARTIVLTGGVLPETELDPGATIFTLEGGGVSEQWTIDIPTEGTHAFSDLAELQFDYEPAVVSQAVAARDEAARQADRSKAEADRAAAGAATVDEVVSDGAAAVRGEFTDLTDRSEAAAAAAEAASATSATHAKESGDSAALSASHAEAAAASQAAAEEAQAGAEEAEAGAETALASANTAKTSAETAQNAAETAQTGAETAQTGAKAAQTGAEAAKAAAAGSATAAKDAATNAAAEVRTDLSGLTERAETAASAAKGSQTAAKTSETKAAEYAAAAAEVVSTGVPDATDANKGAIKLAGDLAGTADAPTVPGLAGKADTAHTHAAADVTGLPAALAKLDAATYAAVAGAIAQRGADGTLAVATPSESGHASTKGYVDNATAGVSSSATATTGAASQANRLVKTGGDGYLHSSGVPTTANHLTPKNYVDSRIVVVADEAAVGTEPGVLYLVTEA